MSLEIRKIVEGIRNTHFPKEETKEFVDKIAEERINICKQCEFYQKEPVQRCMKCGCFLKWKTHSLSSSCPINKWTNVHNITHEESNEIDKIIGNEDE